MCAANEGILTEKLLPEYMERLLLESLGIRMEWKAELAGPDSGWDGACVLHRAGNRRSYAVEVKRTVSSVDIARLLADRPLPTLAADGEVGAGKLVLAEYLSPSVAKSLRELGIDYADAGGNVSLTGPWLIHVEGRKPPKSQGSSGFNLRPMQLTTLLVCNPRLLRQPQRSLAQLAGVSNGLVATALGDLVRRGFLTRSKSGYAGWRNTAMLLDLWAEAYVQKLRERLVVGRYAPVPGVAITELASRIGSVADMVLGGEAGAEARGGELRAGSATIFSAARLDAARAIGLGLVPSRGGSVTEILLPGSDPFEWARDPDRPEFAHPVLVWGELLAGEPHARVLRAAAEWRASAVEDYRKRHLEK